VAKPLLALLPGLDGSGELFFPIVPYLRDRFEIHLVRYADEASFGDYVESAARQLPSGGPVSLLAESFSGPIAISLLAGRRASFQASVLSATFCKSPMPFVTRLARRMPDKLFGYNPASRAFVGLFATGRDASPEVTGKALELLQKVRPGLFRRRIGLVHDLDVTAELKAVEVPLLYIQATGDRIVPARSGAEIDRLARNIKLARVNGPHMILQTRPQECARLIIDHVMTASRTAP
jgi:pimeloyl-ACP methyl ester carboxylesterase